MKSIMMLMACIGMFYYFNTEKANCETIKDAEAKRSQLNSLVREIVSSEDMTRAFALKAHQPEQSRIDQVFKDFYSGRKTEVDFQSFCHSIQRHMSLL